MGLLSAIVESSVRGYRWIPKLGISTRFQHWLSQKDAKRCKDCKKNHGKIWTADEQPTPVPPIHPNGRCRIVPMETIAAGTATINGVVGADYALHAEGTLPEYYVSKEDAIAAGWAWGKDLSLVRPGTMISGGVYWNNNGHLPQAEGRVWQEADINYLSGKRGAQRVVWSNDGLVFVTYDHYETFYEIV